MSKGVVVGIIIGGLTILIGFGAIVLLLTIKCKKQRDERKIQKILELTPVPYSRVRDASPTEAHEITPSNAIAFASSALPLSTSKMRRSSRNPDYFTIRPIALAVQPRVPVSMPVPARALQDPAPASSGNPPSSANAYVEDSSPLAQLAANSGSSSSHLPHDREAAQPQTPGTTTMWQRQRGSNGSLQIAAEDAQTDVPPAPAGNARAGAEDLAAVEGLLTELNRVLARLPPGGVESEDPPEYRG